MSEMFLPGSLQYQEWQLKVHVSHLLEGLLPGFVALKLTITAFKTISDTFDMVIDKLSQEDNP